MGKKTRWVGGLNNRTGRWRWDGEDLKSLTKLPMAKVFLACSPGWVGKQRRELASGTCGGQGAGEGADLFGSGDIPVQLFNCRDPVGAARYRLSSDELQLVLQ